jgi:RND family efflux transporter MFP subunit
MTITHDEIPPPPRGLGKWGTLLVVLLLIVLAVGLIVVGVFPRMRSEKHRDETRVALGDPEPSVVIFHAKRAKSEHTLTLPGSLEAFQEISVNARADGFVKRLTVDIGDHVKSHQVLAVLDAPELQQQRAEAVADVEEARAGVYQAESDLHEIEAQGPRLVADEERARADVQQEQANIQARQSDAGYAKVSNDRWQQLAKEQAISLEDADKRASAYRSAEANVRASEERKSAAQSSVMAAIARRGALKAAIQSGQAKVRSAQALVGAKQATVQRIDARLGFLTVTAPFSGIITARTVDVGSLVSAGGEHSSLFKLARSDRLRLFVDVPENEVPNIHVGQKAMLKFRQFTNPLEGTITRTAGSLDRASRTLKTQIELHNPGFLDPGMHADVSMDLHRNQEVLLVPSTALVIRTAGPKLVVKDAANHIHFVEVEEGLDYGREVEIVRGIRASDWLVNFPSDSLVDGMSVKPIQETAEAK